MVMDVESASLYPERIDRCWNASPSWLSDNNSFLYNRVNSSDVHDPDREKNSKAFLHVMGTDPSADREVLSRALNPGLNIQPEEFPVAFYDKEANHLFGYLSSRPKGKFILCACSGVKEGGNRLETVVQTRR